MEDERMVSSKSPARFMRRCGIDRVEFSELVASGRVWSAPRTGRSRREEKVTSHIIETKRRVAIVEASEYTGVDEDCEEHGMLACCVGTKDRDEACTERRWTSFDDGEAKNYWRTIIEIAVWLGTSNRKNTLDRLSAPDHLA